MTLSIQIAGSSALALDLSDLFDAQELSYETEDRQDLRDEFTGAEILVGYAVVIGGVKATQLIDNMILKIRQRHRPFIVIDVTADDPKVDIVEHADGMEGEVLIKTNSGEEVHLDHGVTDDDVVAAVKGFLGA